MTEAQYFQLCNACDEILLADDSTIERVSIPSLHIIREHPIFLKRYEALFSNKNYFFVKNILNYIQNLVTVIRNLFKEKNYWASTSSLNKSYDVVFVSHLLNNEQAGNETDFYFGDVPHKLKELGYSVVIVLINHTALSSNSIASKWKNNSICRVILSNILPTSTEISLKEKLINESNKIKKLLINSQSNFCKNLITKISIDAVSNETYATYRLNEQFKRLFNYLNPRAVLVTHEGHAWERILFSSARTVNERIICIGYQHAAIFRLQHAIRRSLQPIYNPDFILTAGSVGMHQLKESLHLGSIPINTLGSNRGLMQNEKHIQTRQNLMTCLVIPEGSIDECSLLFDFSLKCAMAFPDFKFIWRLHPIIDFDSLKQANPRFKNIPNNIQLSVSSFEDDLSNSYLALYRGSTAIIKAVLSGLIPIYLQIEDEMSIDPLFVIENLKPTITQPVDLILYSKSKNELLENGLFNFSEVTKYCENFYNEYNFNSLTRILNEN